ncbi:MAG TPA: winged helix-turn-helix domain-containing protein [Nitrososphaeraceae archaeon]|nr:winged helix-turn-helix domain-containing protein [Nitrososphaeraceae archaeon]
MPKRDSYDIIKSVLSIVASAKPLYRNQMNQTRIGYEANLTHPQTVKYLRTLVDLELLVSIKFETFSYYELTRKGRRCLQLFCEVENDLKPSVKD